jgi:chromosome segregation ATPase
MESFPTLTGQPKLGIVSGVVLIGVVLFGVVQHHSEVKENNSLRKKVGELTRLAAENQRLSNIVAVARVTQSEANNQFQELFRLRNEVSRLRQETQDSNLTNQVVLAQATDQLRQLRALQGEASRLRQATQEVENLREQIRELQAAAANAAQTDTGAVAQAEQTQDRELQIRMIRTQGEAFAEKLKRATAAQDNESFQEVFDRFLRMNGVDPSQLSRAFYDERTGRVIIRADQATLDRVERITVALDQAQ